jgi:hypothetical protein
MHKTKATVSVHVVIHFSKELPHGPYGEQGSSQTSVELYLPSESTVRTAKETLQKHFEDLLHQQAQSMNTAKLSATMVIKRVKCKGGVVTDEQPLRELLQDGEALEMVVDQSLTVTPRCLIC